MSFTYGKTSKTSVDLKKYNRMMNYLIVSEENLFLIMTQSTSRLTQVEVTSITWMTKFKMFHKLIQQLLKITNSILQRTGQ